jgi:hypothetical protein
MDNQIDFDVNPTDLIVPETSGTFPRQEPIYLILDLGEGAIQVETRSANLGNDFYTYYGHKRLFRLPDATDASALRVWVDEKILNMADELQDLYESHWDGNNHVAIFLNEDRADELITEISDLCTDDVPCISGHAGLWDVEEWLCPVKSDLTNEVKDMSDDDIEDKAWDLTTEAESDGVVLDGSVRDYLLRLRNEAKAQDEEAV